MQRTYLHFHKLANSEPLLSSFEIATGYCLSLRIVFVQVISKYPRKHTNSRKVLSEIEKAPIEREHFVFRNLLLLSLMPL